MAPLRCVVCKRIRIEDVNGDEGGEGEGGVSGSSDVNQSKTSAPIFINAYR